MSGVASWVAPSLLLSAIISPRGEGPAELAHRRSTKVTLALAGHEDGRVVLPYELISSIEVALKARRATVGEIDLDRQRSGRVGIGRIEVCERSSR